MIEITVALHGRIVRTARFDTPRVRIGRTPENDLQLDNPVLSRRHAELERGPGGWLVRDLESTNGLHVNGRPVTERPIRDGDLIAIGKFVLAIQLLPGDQEGVSTAGGRTLTHAGRRGGPGLSEEPEQLGPVLAHLAVRRGPPHGVFLLRRASFGIGRSQACELPLPGVFAPLRLALIVRGLGGFSLLNVSNRADGVFQNGQPVALRSRLENGDRLEFKSVLATFREGAPTDPKTAWDTQ